MSDNHSIRWDFLDALEGIIDDAIRTPGDWLDVNEEGNELTASEGAEIREIADRKRAEELGTQDDHPAPKSG